MGCPEHRLDPGAGRRLRPVPERLDHLDGWLWSYRDDSFLPHGLAGEPNAARQPVLLTTEAQGNPNQADALFLIDGAEPGALDLARRQWSALKAQGAALSYWKQGAQGGWEKQA